MPILLAIVLCLLAPLAAAQTLQGQVVSVGDGDSLTIRDAARKRHRIRLVDIDAPEREQRFGARSRDSLSELCWKKHAVVEGRGQDQHGRTLGRVTCAGVDANAEQVRRGLAWVYARGGAGSQLHQLEAEARAARRGLWADRNPMPPQEYRRRNPPPPRSRRELRARARLERSGVQCPGPCDSSLPFFWR